MASASAFSTRTEVGTLSLLHGFELSYGGQQVFIPRSSQRLLAFVALHDRPLQRGGRGGIDRGRRGAAPRERATGPDHGAPSRRESGRGDPPVPPVPTSPERGARRAAVHRPSGVDARVRGRARAVTPVAESWGVLV